MAIEGFSLKHVLQVTIGGIAGFIFSISPAFWTLLTLMAIDMGTGLLAAKGKWCPDVMFDGLRKKAIIILLVAAGHVIARSDPLHLSWDVGSALAIGYCVYELLSIFENAGRAGVPFPPAVKTLLKKLNETNLLGTGAPPAPPKEKPDA